MPWVLSFSRVSASLAFKERLNSNSLKKHLRHDIGANTPKLANISNQKLYRCSSQRVPRSRFAPEIERTDTCNDQCNKKDKREVIILCQNAFVWWQHEREKWRYACYDFAGVHMIRQWQNGRATTNSRNIPPALNVYQDLMTIQKSWTTRSDTKYRLPTPYMLDPFDFFQSPHICSVSSRKTKSLIIRY